MNRLRLQGATVCGCTFWNYSPVIRDRHFYRTSTTITHSCEDHSKSSNQVVGTRPTAMTIHKKGTVSRTGGKGARGKNEVATTSTSSDVATTETVEVVSSTSVVEESRQITESESRSSTVETTSASREVIMDSKGNVIKVIETPPRVVEQSSSSSRRTGKSSQDFIAGEQVQSMKQAKATRETSRDGAGSFLEGRVLLQGDAAEERASQQSVQTQSQSKSHTVQQQSISSSTLTESSSSSEDRANRSKLTHVSHVSNGDPVVQTSSRSSESTQMSSEASEMTTKGGQTVSSTTRIRETGGKVDDNGRIVSTSSREVDSEYTTSPDVSAAKRSDVFEKISDKSARTSDTKADKSNVETIARCNKPGQSTWDGTFVYEKPTTPKGRSTPESVERTTRGDKSIADKTVSFTAHDDTRRGIDTSVEVTQESSSSSFTTEATSMIDQVVSSSTATRDYKTMMIDEGRSSSTGRRDFTSQHQVAKDTTDFSSELRHVADEKLAKEPIRHAKPGDSSWNGSFVMEKVTETKRRRNNDDVVETTQRKDLKEKSGTAHVVKGATDSTRFISEERHDLSRESVIHVDDSSSGKEERIIRVSSPSHRRPGRPGDSSWNGEFVYERAPGDAKKRPSDLSVVRRTEKRHDSVDVQDVTEEQSISNVSETVSTSYIVEYASASDKKNVEKVTSVSEVIAEEDAPDERKSARGSPERQVKPDTPSRCYKPGQSTWDGTFVYERPKTPEVRRRPEDKGTTVKTVDIRDVTEDNSINEADITSTSYIVEHSSSQQSFSDVRDASLSSTIYETVIYEGHPVEMTIRIEEDRAPRSKVSTPERQNGPAARPTSPEKTPKERDLRTTKPGSSTWDGTFVREKPQEKRRPPSRESVDDKVPDKARPVDSQKISPLVDTPKGHVSETTINLRDVTQDVSGTSEILESSVVVEKSRLHESYTDSSDLGYSSTSMETVITRDGQPTTSTQKTVQEGPVKRLPGGDVITLIDVKESTIKSSEKKESYVDDRSYRPTKPGSSTWDGSFVYEKPEEKRPTDRKTPRADKPSPSKERPIDITDRSTSVTRSQDKSKDVTSSIDYTVSSVQHEQTLVTDSKTYDSSQTFIEDAKRDKVISVDHDEPRRPSEEKLAPSPRKSQDDDREVPGGVAKSPVDRMHRPSKPGASTWDGSFVYEKAQDSRKKSGENETDRPTEQRKPPGEEPAKVRVQPTPVPRKVMDDKRQQDVRVVRYGDVADVSLEVQQQSTYVVDQSSSFTSVQDIRDVRDERIITEFTTDTRNDVVSKPEVFLVVEIVIQDAILV